MNNLKTTFGLTQLASWALIAGIFATVPTQAAEKTNYITVKEIKAMTPCTVTFAKRLSEFGGSFTNAEGRSFVMGDIRGEQWVWHFVGALREGQAYKLPDTFLNYEAGNHYVTPKEIAAMESCQAMLVSRTPCSSTFVTPEGKWFGIGDPGSGPEISQFIWSLKPWETNKFPKVFLDYQAATHYDTVKEISEMTPRKATLVEASIGSSYFKGADGTGFFIGGTRSEKEVDQFLQTLEEDKSYQFPKDFLKYQKDRRGTKP